MLYLPAAINNGNIHSIRQGSNSVDRDGLSTHAGYHSLFAPVVSTTGDSLNARTPFTSHSTTSQSSSTVYLTDHGLSMPVCVSTKFHQYDPHSWSVLPVYKALSKRINHTMQEKGSSSGSHARARRTVPHGSVPCDADPGLADVLSSLPHLPYAQRPCYRILLES
jgi:hypothetical protein